MIRVSGNSNPVADALSRIAALTPAPNSSIDLDAIATAQSTDEQLMEFHTNSSSPFKFEDPLLPTSSNTITCDMSTGKPRPICSEAISPLYF